MQEIMMRNVVQDALAGTRRIAITFKPDAIDRITYLWTLNYFGFIKLEHDDVIEMVTRPTHSWSSQKNRTFMVELTKKFNKDIFFEQMNCAFEEINVVA